LDELNRAIRSSPGSLTAGELIRFLRGRRSVSVPKLARRAGVSRESIYALESGRGQLRSEGTALFWAPTYSAICQALRIPEKVARIAWPEHPRFKDADAMNRSHEIIEMWLADEVV
jgi:transcriptional regulator with XRE-family HTH domain